MGLRSGFQRLLSPEMEVGWLEDRCWWQKAYNHRTLAQGAGATALAQQEHNTASEMAEIRELSEPHGNQESPHSSPYPVILPETSGGDKEYLRLPDGLTRGNVLIEFH